MAVCCRIAHNGETDAVKALWQHCFADPVDFADWYFNKYYQSSNTMVAVEDGEIRSALQLIPYTIFCRNTKLKINYLVGMGTYAEHRYRGLAKQLILFSLAEMERRKEGYTMLLPAIPPFYAKMGWTYGYDLQTYRYTSTAPSTASVLQIPAEQAYDHIAQCNRVYSQFCASYHGYTLRSAKNWQAILKDISLQHGQVVMVKGAYLFYTEKENRANIVDAAWVSEEAILPLLHFLQQKFGAVTFNSAVSCQTPFLQIVQEPQPFMMGRIASVPMALEAVSYPAYNHRLILSVYDPLCAWNNRFFTLAVNDGHAQVKPTEENDPAQTITLDIAALTALFLGYRSVQQLQAEQKIKGEKAELEKLDQLFPPCVNYIHDYF